MDILYIIPARAGSKGLPKKNIKLLKDKPLICYTIEFALNIISSKDIICVTTDDLDVIEIIKSKYNLEVPFIRPSILADDTASTFDVIMHALIYYKKRNINFNKIVLLQPTSPIRIHEDFVKMLHLYNQTHPDMVVSVKQTKENPYFTLFEENEKGKLIKSKQNSLYKNRQECPPVYAYNGCIYIINTNIFLKLKNFNFENILKYEMPESRSVDIDTQADWVLAEYYLNFINENS